MIISKLHTILNKFNSKRSKPISVRELSRTLGINRTTLLNLVNNKATNISFKNLNKLVEFFNVKVSDLIKYTNNSYIINLNYRDTLPLNYKHYSSMEVGNPVTNELVNNYYVLTCNQIPNVHFVIIPFMVVKNKDSYRFELLCHCTGTSPLSKSATKFQHIINEFPKSLMYYLLNSIYISLEFNKGLRTEMTNKPINVSFNNYAPVSKLLNNMIDFNGYHIIYHGGATFVNCPNKPVDQKVHTHSPIKLNDGSTCIIYNNVN